MQFCMKHKYAYGVDDAGGATAFYVVDSYEGCGRVRIDEGIAKLKDVCDTCGNACRMVEAILSGLAIGAFLRLVRFAYDRR